MPATLVGEPLHLTVNGEHIADLLTALGYTVVSGEAVPAEEVRLSAKGPRSPTLGEDPRMPGFRHVMMPVVWARSSETTEPASRAKRQSRAPRTRRVA
ncbi:MAG: hypothetical protein HY332_23920 [Chloroflexi bacterium]|nr:hypothetical protein [Chloroflexota bacterium]